MGRSSKRKLHLISIARGRPPKLPKVTQAQAEEPEPVDTSPIQVDEEGSLSLEESDEDYASSDSK